MLPTDLAALVLIALAPLVAAWLWFRPAPYGRHSAPGWGPSLNGRLGWVLMESPSVLVFGGVLVRGGPLGGTAVACAALWLGHYVHRGFVFPFRLRSPRPMPAVIAATGAAFNSVNAWANATALQSGPPADLWLALGGLGFIVGLVLNVDSDNRVLRLRDRGPGYHLPEGGGFRWVSSPNYLGELVQWAAYALAARSLPALAFFIFTAANLVPRARDHHRWYQRTFPDLPAGRRILLPALW